MALYVAVTTIGIGPDDNVIMPTFTIISCAAEVVRANEKLVLIDSDPATRNMDVGQIAQRITARTLSIIVVHIYGLTVDMGPILELAVESHGLQVIEDAAEINGQTWNGRSCASFVYSFYLQPNKYLTTGLDLVRGEYAVLS